MTSLRHPFSFLVVAFLSAGVLWLGQITRVRADGITVTSAADTDTDDGLCTLREAITNANNNNTSGSVDCAPGGGSADTITFAADYIITLTSALPNLSNNLAIDASGRNVTLSGNNSVRGFRLQSGSLVTISHLSIISGLGTVNHGGGILVEAGATLNLVDSTVSGNQSDRGGGIYNNDGLVTLSQSTLSDNRAGIDGGGLYNNGGVVIIEDSRLSGNQAQTSVATAGNGGGIFNTGILSLTHSTLANNSAAPFGGGLFNASGEVTILNSTLSGNLAQVYNNSGDGGAIFNSGGLLTLNNSTLSGNSAAGTGGIFNEGSLHLRHSLIANSGGGECTNSGGQILTNLNNLIEDGSCNSSFSGDPLLGPLQDNGGFTSTHAPLPGSPAIDAGDPSCAAADQRHIARPQGGRCDLGAFESRGFNLTLTGGDAQSSLIRLPFEQPLALTINSAFAEPVGPGGLIRFSAPLSGASLNPPVFTATTTSTGTASQVVTANTLIGSYSVTATATGVIAPLVFNLTNHDLCPAAVTVTNLNTSGSGSLSQAMLAVCEGGTIEIDSSLSNETLLLAGELSSNRNLTIANPNAPGFTISGNQATRLFRIRSGGVVTLTNLNLIHGVGDIEGGGAILVEAGATLTLSGVALSDNTLGYVDPPDKALGGGLINSGTLTINNSTISNNSARDDSIISPSPGYGGGIYNVGTLTLISTTLSDNFAFGGYSTGSGGGIYNTGTLTLINSSIIANAAIGGEFQGSGIGGGIFNENGTLVIMNSTLARNYTRGYRYVAGSGGAIHNTGTLLITNSTLSNNSVHIALFYGGGAGGGINNSGTLTMTNTTLSNNNGGAGGGLANSGPLYFSNSLIANSWGGPDCANSSPGTIVTNLNNLVEDGSCSQNGVNFLSGDPRLGVLQDNGGLTLTQAPLPGSSVLNKGNNSAATGLEFDQRGPGFPRILDGTVDIGAVEGVSSKGLLYFPIVLKKF